MHLVLRKNSLDGDYTFTITTGKNILEWHFGKMGGPLRSGRSTTGSESEITLLKEHLLTEKLEAGYTELSRSNFQLESLEKDRVSIIIRDDCIDRFSAIESVFSGFGITVGGYQLRYSATMKVVEVYDCNDVMTLSGQLRAGSVFSALRQSNANTLVFALWKAGLADIVTYPGFNLGSTWRSASPIAKTYTSEHDYLFIPGDVMSGLGTASMRTDFRAFVELFSYVSLRSMMAEIFASAMSWNTGTSQAALL